jgi:hypothetical protein
MRSRPLVDRERETCVLYYQCSFRRGTERTVAWIEARGAKVGAHVELITLDDGAPWEVQSVGAVPLALDELKQMQRLNRKSLPSILGKNET